MNFDLMLLQRVCRVLVVDSFGFSGFADTILSQPPNFLRVLFNDSFIVLAKQDWSACLSQRSCEELDLHLGLVSLLSFQSYVQVYATHQQRQVDPDKFHIIPQIF